MRSLSKRSQAEDLEYGNHERLSIERSRDGDRERLVLRLGRHAGGARAKALSMTTFSSHLQLHSLRIESVDRIRIESVDRIRSSRDVLSWPPIVAVCVYTVGSGVTRVAQT